MSAESIRLKRKIKDLEKKIYDLEEIVNKNKDEIEKIKKPKASNDISISS